MSNLHVLFRVADSDYVVSAADVLHMEAFTGATKVPGTLDHVAGLMQIRQRVVPIVDLRVRFGLPATEVTSESRVVVVRDGERAVGLLVDRAREVVEIAADQFRTPPNVITQQAQGFVTAVAQTGAQAGAKLVMLIDIQKVIGEEALSGEQRN